MTMLVSSRKYAMETTIRSKKVNSTEVDAFKSAVQYLAQKLGAVAKDEPMPISKFKSKYSDLLNAAQNGRVQQISRGRERYVLLTEEQVISMARSSSKRSSLADTLASIQAPAMPINASLVMIAGSKIDQFSLVGSGV